MKDSKKGESKTPQQLGLTEKKGFHGESPESLGMGRSEDTGKPKGPAKGSAARGHRWG